MKDITIAVATHKEYEMPNESIYLPIHVGAELTSQKLKYVKDNTGDNISSKNLNFCELTSLYWLWKNNSSEYKGLTHYRRHFSNKKKVSLFSKGKFEDVLKEERVRILLQENDIILPEKRKYYIETIKSHYSHTHYDQDLFVTRKVIENNCPSYLKSFDIVLNQKSAHMFNMFIMKREYFDDYCEWLFDILFELELNLDISEYSNFHKRVFGRISEILLDVWLLENKLPYTEIPVSFMEKQNWILKINKFLKAKLLDKRY